MIDYEVQAGAALADRQFAARRAARPRPRPDEYGKVVQTGDATIVSASRSRIPKRPEYGTITMVFVARGVGARRAAAARLGRARFAEQPHADRPHQPEVQRRRRRFGLPMDRPAAAQALRQGLDAGGSACADGCNAWLDNSDRTIRSSWRQVDIATLERSHGERRPGFPLLPAGLPAPSFKSVTNADLTPVPRPRSGGLSLSAAASLPNSLAHRLGFACALT